MSKKSMTGLSEQLEHGGVTNKKIVELLLDFTLPPPVYGYHLTTNRDKEQRTIKFVTEINRHPDGLEVISVEGNRYVIATSSIKFYVED